MPYLLLVLTGALFGGHIDGFGATTLVTTLVTTRRLVNARLRNAPHGIKIREARAYTRVVFAAKFSQVR